MEVMGNFSITPGKGVPKTKGSSLAGGLPPPNTTRETSRIITQGQNRLPNSPPKPAARSRLTIGEFGPSDFALTASSGWRLRRPAADQHVARCASRDLCSGGAPRRYPPSDDPFVGRAARRFERAAPILSQSARAMLPCLRIHEGIGEVRIPEDCPDPG